MSHTKGPWKKQGNIIFGAEIGRHVCKLFTQHIPSEKSGAAEEAANAYLIAAAPELYEIVSLMSNGAITYEDPRINAALKKARGEQ